MFVGLCVAAPRPAFSSSCTAAKRVSRMVSSAEVVVEAVVTAVSPVRNKIYAVTLKVDCFFQICKLL